MQYIIDNHALYEIPTYDIINYGLYSYDQVSHVCQFPSIESWEVPVPENYSCVPRSMSCFMIFELKL